MSPSNAQLSAELEDRLAARPEDNKLQPRILAPNTAGHRLDEQLPTSLSNLVLADAEVMTNDKKGTHSSMQGIASPNDHNAESHPPCVPVPSRKVTRSNRAALTDATNIYTTALGGTETVDTKASIPKKSSRVRIKKEATD